MATNPLIFVLDDEAAVAKGMQDVISQQTGAAVRVFYDAGDMLAAEDLDRVDLFVLDVHLGGNVSGFDLPARLPARCRFAAFLFVSGFAINKTQFSQAAGLPFFDFIAKPFLMDYFVHRVNLLLAARLKMPAGLDDQVLQIWSRAPYVAMVLDKDLNFRMVNHQLALLLEVGTSRDLVGRTFGEFLPDDDRAADFRGVLAAVIAGDLSRFGEYSADVQTAGGVLHRVRWFNSPFAGDDAQTVLTLSVGVPGEQRRQSIADLRRAWRQNIVVHRAAITAIKKMPLRSPQPATECHINGGPP